MAQWKIWGPLIYAVEKLETLNKAMRKRRGLNDLLMGNGKLGA